MNKRNGFTIIEVSLVLAIAGVIFAMVFVALPALWASQRDSDRKDDMITFINELKNFQTNNNRGALPSLSNSDQSRIDSGLSVTINGSSALPSATITGKTWTDFYKGYLDESFTDPSGNRYNLVITGCGTKTLDATCTASAIRNLADSQFPNGYKLYVVLSATCDGESAKYSANSRKVALLYRLESSGIYCANS